MPLLSYNVLNYAAGLTEIRFSSYISMTLVALLPGVIVFLNPGDKALHPESMEFIVAVTLLIALSVVSLIMVKACFNAKKVV